MTDTLASPPNTKILYETTRADYLLIADMVTEHARVLDIGCGDGDLLQLLRSRKTIDGRGIEISQKGVNRSVARGLSVVHGDADRDLANYPDKAFDYAILSQTIQATHRPKHVLEQLLRISNHAIVSFPNFGYWKIRTQFFFTGQMPVTGTLPKNWHDTDNIHLCTLQDFVLTCRELGAVVEKSYALNGRGEKLGWPVTLGMQNLFAEQAIFLLKPGAS